jgi:hypothetical protein
MPRLARALATILTAASARAHDVVRLGNLELAPASEMSSPLWAPDWVELDLLRHAKSRLGIR